MRTVSARRTNKRSTDIEASAPPTPPAPPLVNGLAEPKSPSAKKEPAPSSTTFWEVLHDLGDRWQTEDISVYLYRLWPVTDQKNPERYLAKLKEPFDEDFVMRHYGSGKYWLLLNDGRGKNLRKHVLNIHNPAHGPRV